MTRTSDVWTYVSTSLLLDAQQETTAVNAGFKAPDRPWTRPDASGVA